jgi:hypothetical protein
MRQGQQHRRGRSRGSSGGNGSHGSHNHRKGQNPLSRSFESNGPDVKVRGTAADVAAKYMALARDAQTSGDPVLAENYLQHAEHYNRMIIAYREQQMQQNGGDMANGNGHRVRHVNEFGEQGDDADGEPLDPGMAEQPPMPGITRHHHEGQPRQENGRHEMRSPDERRDDRRHDDRRPQHGRQDNRPDNRHDRGDNPRFRDRRFDRGDRQDRQDRGERIERQDRPERQDRQERSEYRADPVEMVQEERPVRAPAPVPVEQPQPVIEPIESAARQPVVRRRERFDMMKDQPEFLRRPVRRPRREDTSAADADDAASASAEPQEKPST